ncbi:SDR family oxidoreductase [Nocardia sp. NPDC058640]|uniref:SDR family oxidoreductase n=1 Tax=Nocardia sp. NPDC058640 TaxID=3346571 RepID=UPI0036687052
MRHAITGATGFLGTYLLRELLRDSADEFTLLTRQGGSDPLQRIATAWELLGTPASMIEQLHRRCIAVPVELEQPRFGFTEQRFRELADEVDAVWHVAASTNFLAELDVIRQPNVVGTQRVLEFTETGARQPDLFHISTAYIAGRTRVDVWYEHDLHHDSGFEVPYEQAKYEAEILVREWAQRTGRRTVVLRPSIVISDRPQQAGLPSHTISTIGGNVESWSRLRGLSTRRRTTTLPPTRLVGDPDGHLNFIPVDDAAVQMVRLAAAAPTGLSTYHVVHHEDVPNAVLLDMLRALSPVDVTLVAEPPTDLNLIERSATRSARGFVPYLIHTRLFDNSRARELLGGFTSEIVVDLDYLLAGVGCSGADPEPETSAMPSSEPPRRPHSVVSPVTDPLPHRLESEVAPIAGLAFVVTTGRSGSTALSEVLRRHREVLSLNEFFLAVRTTLPRGEKVSPETFWRAIADPHPLFDPMVRGGAGMPELIYPRLPDTRFAADTTGIPAISLMTLPHLSHDPDAVYDQLQTEIATWPTQSVDQHFRQLFGWLAHRFGGTVVVERSGMSLGWVPWLRATFPEAKFVHLYRDAADTAVSMSRHTGFRLMALIQDALELLDVDESHRDTWRFDPSTLPSELLPILGDAYDRDHLMSLNLPITRFARMWSDLIDTGLDALDQHPVQRVLPLSYADLIAEPERALGELADFLGIDRDPDWLRYGATVFDPSYAGAASNLSAAERDAIAQVCRPASIRLGIDQPN